MSRSSFHAMRHPCFNGNCYICDCEHKSFSIEAHRRHLKEHPECREKNATAGDLKAIAGGLTQPQEKALRIFLNLYRKDRYAKLSARFFAQEMWPDSDGWKRVSNQGNGATSGKGMWLRAGVFLRKLGDLGYLYHDISGNTVVWYITGNGIEALGEKP